MLKRVKTKTAPDWLLPLLAETASSRFMVGGVGHLLLNREEETVVGAALEVRVLPMVCDLSAGRPITLFTGLAPGADVLLMDCAHRWCARNGVELRIIGLCAVPPGQLIDDWVIRAEKAGYTLSEGDHQKLQATMQSALASCDVVIPLYPPGSEASLVDPLQRQKNYQQLAAVLAEHSDLLVAILNEDHVGQPGGTAEVVTWRQHQSRIPPGFSTHSANPQKSIKTELILVNPMPARVTMQGVGADIKVKKLLQEARAAVAAGNELLANDLLYRGLQQGLQHPDLHYLRVQVLASIGSSDLALKEYEALAPLPAEREERWLTLAGRIHKDLALRTNQQRLFLKSAAHYLEAWNHSGSSYSAINTASMYAMGLDLEQAQSFARKALESVSNESIDSEEQQYFAAATRAEAMLILGDTGAVQRQLMLADQVPRGRARRSRTLQQLKRLCAVLQVSTTCLRPLTLPPLIVLRRLGLADIRPVEAVEDVLIPRFAANATLFTGLCDSFDLVLVEALLMQGHSLHLVLPYRAERMIEGTRERLGDEWAQRLQQCLQRAARVHTEHGFMGDELAWAAGNVTERVLGLAMLSAQRFGGSVQMVEIDPDSQPPRFIPYPDFDDPLLRVRQAVGQLHASEPTAPAPAGRRMVGLIFADFAGFQRLEDVDLMQFWSVLMSGIAELLTRHAQSILLRHTWGDALHVVTTDAQTAAWIMADIQQYLDLHRLKPGAPLANLTLRMAGHYAPVFEGHDPIHAARTYFGTQLSLTARIEPVTPPGQIYATEAFAARLAIEDAKQFALEYAGEIELAKRFGAYRLYSLRRVLD